MKLNNITVNTQNSIRIEGSKVIYFDPFQIGEEKGDADVIFVTHDHYDHFDPEAIAKIKKDTTKLVVPKSMINKAIKESGLPKERIVGLEVAVKTEIESMPVETVPAYNKLKPFHAKGFKWVGYIVTMDECRYFIAGDTDENRENSNVNCDVAFLPIGGFYTMDKKAAADLALKIKPKCVIPTHYGSIVGEVKDGEDFKQLVEEKNAAIQVELVCRM